MSQDLSNEAKKHYYMRVMNEQLMDGTKRTPMQAPLNTLGRRNRNFSELVPMPTNAKGGSWSRYRAEIPQAMPKLKLSKTLKKAAKKVKSRSPKRMKLIDGFYDQNYLPAVKPKNLKRKGVNKSMVVKRNPST